MIDLTPCAHAGKQEDARMRHTLGGKVVETLWPEGNKFETAWGRKTRTGLAACIDELTAAPDLLAACKTALEHLGICDDRCYESGESGSEVILQIEAAIAKAEGRA